MDRHKALLKNGNEFMQIASAVVCHESLFYIQVANTQSVLSGRKCFYSRIKCQESRRSHAKLKVSQFFSHSAPGKQPLILSN